MIKSQKEEGKYMFMECISPHTTIQPYIHSSEIIIPEIPLAASPPYA